MSGRLAHIVRHPIKSIGWEELPAVELTAGRVLPGDRRWAIAHEAAGFDGAPEGWQAKRNFVRGVAGPQLMAVTAALSEDGERVTLSHPQRPSIDVTPDKAEDGAALVEWVKPLWPDTRPAAARVVTAGRQALSDMAEPYVSVLSLASLRALSESAGSALSIHRFRGNLWMDGLAPWEETGWIGRDLRIGSTRLTIEMPITRCNATKVNPETGIPDVDTLGLLEELFGHRQFGLYARVVEGGTIRTGDEMEPV